MDTSYLSLLTYLSALISVGAAVVSVMVVRRGADADLKGDVNDLARFVERLAKDQRSDRMRRVRQGAKLGADVPEPMEIPPGAENIALGGSEAPVSAKEELRRRVLAARGIGR
jgi:hypothetical protein